MSKVGGVRMTRRKPPGRTWQSWTEEQIRDAEREGAFEDLPGRGKPLPDAYQPYDPDWWLKSLVQREQISILPPALEARRKLSATLAKIRELSDEAAVRREIESFNTALGRLNALASSGPPTHIGRLNVEATVERWREERRPRESE
jgi:hypothetical protein